jgi:hypothetical protein
MRDLQLGVLKGKTILYCDFVLLRLERDLFAGQVNY